MGIKTDAPHSKRVVGVSAEKKFPGAPPPVRFLPVWGVGLPVLFWPASQSVGVGSMARRGRGPQSAAHKRAKQTQGGLCTRKAPLPLWPVGELPFGQWVASRGVPGMGGLLLHLPVRRHPYRLVWRRWPPAPLAQVGLRPRRWPVGGRGAGCLPKVRGCRA